MGGLDSLQNVDILVVVKSEISKEDGRIISLWV